MTDTEFILLAGGGNVSKAAVEALDKLEETLPGATCPQARPAIVQAVTKALKK